jgi:hypothetical protein
MNQQINRLNELMTLARQRYLEAGGDSHRTPSGLPGDDYLTHEERREALALAQNLFNEEYINTYLNKKKSSRKPLKIKENH